VPVLVLALGETKGLCCCTACRSTYCSSPLVYTVRQRLCDGHWLLLWRIDTLPHDNSADLQRWCSVRKYQYRIRREGRGTTGSCLEALMLCCCRVQLLILFLSCCCAVVVLLSSLLSCFPVIPLIRYSAILCSC
jgi:hypothetical protein